MGLKAVYEKEDEIPAEYKDLYIEQDGVFIIEPIEGLKPESEVKKIQLALQKERSDHKLVKGEISQIKAFGDIPAIIDTLTRFPELEQLSKGNVDDTKIQSLVEQRLTAKLTPLQKELETERKKSIELETEVNTLRTEKTVGVISSAIRKAAFAAGIKDEIVLEDVVELTVGKMEVDEDTGSVITKDGLSLNQFFTTMQDKKPHWFGVTQGGGAPGTRRGGSAIENPFSNEHWNLTKQGVLVKDNPEKAEQLAKMAGTTVGGGKPAKK